MAEKPSEIVRRRLFEIREQCTDCESLADAARILSLEMQEQNVQLLERIADGFEPPKVHPSGSVTDIVALWLGTPRYRIRTRNMTAEDLRTFVDSLPDMPEDSLFADLVGWALGGVDWDELAEEMEERA